MLFDLTQEILLKCNVNLAGHGDRILVLCQTLTENQTIWRHQVHSFGQNFKCLTFDFMGSGKSDVKTTEAQRYIHIQQHLADFLTILDRLSIEKVDFIGHGLGGNIGLLACSQRPELFQSMHLLDVTPKYLTSDAFDASFSRLEFDRLWQLLGSDYLGWSEISHIHDQQDLLDNASLRTLYQSLKTLRPDFAQGVLRIMYELDQRELLPTINLPLHFYHSLKEPIIPYQISAYYDENLPSCKVKILNSEGCQPQMTTPDELNQLLNTYLA